MENDHPKLLPINNSSQVEELHDTSHMTYKNVVIPVDSNKVSFGALKWYIKCMHNPQNKVILMYMNNLQCLFIKRENGDIGIVSDNEQRFSKKVGEIKCLLKNFIDECIRNKIVHELVSIYCKNTDPREQLIKAIYECNAFTVVMGNYHTNFFEKLFTKNMAIYVMRRIAVPIVIVPSVAIKQL